VGWRRILSGRSCEASSLSWYEPFDRQDEFHQSERKYRLFGGAAGPGKTKALLAEAIAQAYRVDGSDSLLLRRTYPELESSLLTYFRRDVPRDLYRSYNEAKHVVTWNNGSTTRFGYCRNENDVYRYQGAEFLFIGIDELTHFTLKQWQFLTSRNRCPIKAYTSGEKKGKPVRPCMAGATNPGNIGHAWVKALWVDKTAPAGFERPELYDPEDYDFIRALISDNPVYANDVNYKKTLSALPDRLRRAFLEGDWSVFAGQYFDLFEIGRHTARAEDLRLEEWAPRWISIDWGFHHPSAVYWHGASPVISNQLSVTSRRGPGQDSSTSATGRNPESRTTFSGRADGSSRIVTYREFVQNGLSPRMLAQAIVDRTGRERIQEIYLSPDAFAQRTSEASIAEQLGDVLQQNGLPRPVPADDDRVGGWQLMYQLLERDAWVIAENCGRLIECLPLLVRDERRVEDVRKVDGDDPADAARYGLIPGARYAGVGATAVGGPGAGQAPPEFAAGTPRFVPGIPVDVQIERQISAEDPTSRAIHWQRLESEARKQMGPRKFGRRMR
jgi:phage terminase large subunit